MMKQRGNINKKGFCFPPGYRWCGPGCNGPGAPINDVDALCKAHDECYRRLRDPCKCDQEFMTKLQTKMDEKTEKGRHARMLYNYMKLQTAFTCRFRRL
ncbi:phospholipase A2 family protein [Cerasibacillus sp. JNUCC 74]